MGEPKCFACGSYDQSVPTVPRVRFDRAWAMAGLDRAHLVPRSLGGSNEVHNLVLLCHMCHADAPDWRHPSLMLEWMDERPHWWHLITERCGGFDVFLQLARVPDWGEKYEAALEDAALHVHTLKPATTQAVIAEVLRSVEPKPVDARPQPAPR